MLRFVLFKLTTVYLLISLCIASSYEEKTVYTQALLRLRYKTIDKHSDGYSANGKYAKDSPKTSAKGLLYYAGQDVDWCKPFFPSKGNGDWIALIPRENNSCSDGQKIKLAQKLNASAVILYDNKNVEIPVINEPTNKMVTVMITLSSGQELIEKLNQHPSVQCEILVGTHYVDRRWKVSRTSVLFVLVSFILLMCISLAWLVFYYVQRFRHIYRNDRKEKQLLSAAKKAISKLKTRGFQDAQKEEPEEACAVCLENYKDGETLRILPCKHEFHKSCIDPWLLNHRTCPMCKSNILKSLGVEMPEPTNYPEELQQRTNLRVAGLLPHDVESAPVVTIIPAEPLPQAWMEATHSITKTSSNNIPMNQENRYSSSSSAASDTDSDRSTVALVSHGHRV